MIHSKHLLFKFFSPKRLAAEQLKILKIQSVAAHESWSLPDLGLSNSSTLHVVYGLLTFRIETKAGPIDRRSDRTGPPDANGTSSRNQDRAGAGRDADANGPDGWSRTKAARGIPVRNGHLSAREKSRERNS